MRAEWYQKVRTPSSSATAANSSKPRVQSRWRRSTCSGRGTRVVRKLGTPSSSEASTRAQSSAGAHLAVDHRRQPAQHGRHLGADPGDEQNAPGGAQCLERVLERFRRGPAHTVAEGPAGAVGGLVHREVEVASRAGTGHVSYHRPGAHGRLLGVGLVDEGVLDTGHRETRAGRMERADHAGRPHPVVGEIEAHRSSDARLDARGTAEPVGEAIGIDQGRPDLVLRLLEVLVDLDHGVSSKWRRRARNLAPQSFRYWPSHRSISAKGSGLRR